MLSFDGTKMMDFAAHLATFSAMTSDLHGTIMFAASWVCRLCKKQKVGHISAETKLDLEKQNLIWKSNECTSK